MAVHAYIKQSLVRCKMQFFDANGAAADPTTVTFYWATPAPPITRQTYLYGTDVQVVREGAGVYHVDLIPTITGSWIYGFIGTGAVAIAKEGTFFVESLLG